MYSSCVRHIFCRMLWKTQISLNLILYHKIAINVINMFQNDVKAITISSNQTLASMTSPSILEIFKILIKIGKNMKCLHHHCVKSVRIRSFSGPNVRKYGPEKLRIGTLLTQGNILNKPEMPSLKNLLHVYVICGKEFI